MNYTNYTIKSSIDRYKNDIIVSILYIISLFSVYHFTYDKGTLETYYITSIRLKSNIYNVDDKEFKSIYVCNVNTGVDDDKRVICVDAYDYNIMVKNKANTLTRYENGGHSLLSYILYTLLTMGLILFIIIRRIN